MSLFEREIAEQPEVAARVLAEARADVQAAAGAMAAGSLGLVIAARGSSDHAAVYAKYLFETRNRLPVALAAPSAFTLYGSPPRLERFAVLAISQSGTSPDVVEVVAEARRQGSVTVALTNRPDSALGAAAEHVVCLRAGEELSVPATKTYTASLLVLALLSLALQPEPEFAAAVERVPEALERVLHARERLEPLVSALADADRLAVLGRGYNLATALEVGLKLMEAAAVVAEARSVADFKHGPIAIVEPGFPVLLLEAAGPATASMGQLASELAGRGARVLRIGDGAPVDHGAAAAACLASGLPESLTPLSLVAAGQLLTAGLAAARGLDPDRPRGLRKVTSTL